MSSAAGTIYQGIKKRSMNLSADLSAELSTDLTVSLVVDLSVYLRIKGNSWIR